MDNSMDELKRHFYALSDDVRLEIVRLLINNEAICACKFQKIFKMKISQPNLSFHLKVLRQAGIVRTRKEGTWLHYMLNYEDPLMKLLIPAIKGASRGKQ